MNGPLQARLIRRIPVHMRNGWKMLLACLMCLALLGAAAVSLAETTTLEVSLTGLTALADGSWRTEGLSGSF